MQSRRRSRWHPAVCLRLRLSQNADRTPGIKSGVIQSGAQTNQTDHRTNSKLMKKRPNKIREIRRLLADAAHIDHEHAPDGVDRRGFLKCMAWAGTGMLWTVSGGVLGSRILSPVGAVASENPA